MMYLVNTFVAGATAVELRNLTVDHANSKIKYNNHNLSNGDIVRASAAGAGLAQDKMYVVESATTNDFSLKNFNAADAKAATAGPTWAALTDESSAMTLKKYGTKKCLIKDTTTADNKIECKTAPTFATTDKLMIYCESTAGDDCKISGTNDKVDNLDVVYALAANVAKFKVSDTKSGTEIGLADAIHANSKEKIWLLSEDSTCVYPAAPAATGDAAKWDPATDTGLCGGKCAILKDSFYFYTEAGTKTDGLVTNTVYKAAGADLTPYKFTLLATDADTTGTLKNKDANNIDIKTSGAGNKFTKVDKHRQITACYKSDDANKPNGCDVKTGTDHAAFAVDTKVTFYCSDVATTDACKYNITGGTNGATFKLKAVNGTGDDANGTRDVTFKAATGTDAAVIAVSANSATSMTAGFLLTMAADAADSTKEDVTVFPPAAAAGGSAARSFAMLGSAFGMATAFLFA